MFYVYLHIERDTGLPFYVGKGKHYDSRVPRMERQDTRSIFWKHVAEKHGWYSDIIAEFDTEQEAFECERSVIKFFGRRDKGTGILVNLTDGGEGNAGTFFTEERRRKMSAGRKGIPVSAEVRKKMSDAAKKRKGRKHSEETKQKLRERCKEGTLRKWEDKEYRTKVVNSHVGIRYPNRKSPKPHVTKQGVNKGSTY